MPVLNQCPIIGAHSSCQHWLLTAVPESIGGCVESSRCDLYFLFKDILTAFGTNKSVVSLLVDLLCSCRHNYPK